MRLSEAFNPKANGLNLLRLCLAISVIVWHSFPLTGRDVDFAPARQFLSDVPVDGFFALSGFLIAGSWVRRPEFKAFLKARALRILPGYWICLLLTIVALAPIGVASSGERLPEGYLADGSQYLLHNAGLYVGQYDIAGTPFGVPNPEAWNGSLWTLQWEFGCYIGVLILGLLGLVTRRLVILLLFVLAVLGAVAVEYGPLDGYWATSASRFGLMFLAGILVYTLRDSIPVRAVFIAGAGVLVIVTQFMGDYRIVGAFALAYFLIALGSCITNPRVRLKNDISYGVYIYAFPVQQILAGTGVVDTPVIVFMVTAIALTVPLAMASWVAIERPALRLKRVARPDAGQINTRAVEPIRPN